MQSRRKFIKNLSLISIGSSMSQVNTSYFSLQENEPLKKLKIAVIGAGLAGLRTAYMLSKDDRCEVRLFEGSNRLGGRIYTDRATFSSDVSVELGGEFIDSGHHDIHNLIKEFNLEKVDTWFNPGKLSSYEIFIKGKNRKRCYENEWLRWNKSFVNDRLQIEEPIFKERLNQYSLEEYLNTKKITGWFRDYLRWIFTAEFGLDYSEINCLYLHEMIGFKDGDTKNPPTLFEDVTDQRYKIKGGNDKLISAIAENIKENIILKHNLLSIQLNDSQYQLNFSNNKTEFADYVVLAIPLSVLSMIKLDAIKFSNSKRQMIDNTGYGTNSKVILEFKERIWRSKKSVGSIITDNLQSGWDTSIMQNENTGMGIYTFFMGGNEGKSTSNISDHVSRCLNRINEIYPGSRKAYTGNYKVYNWNDSAFSKGSYACLKPGQWLSYDNSEWQKPEGKIYFAGEHCSSSKYQGFMNGAAESARIVVERLINDISNKVKK